MRPGVEPQPVLATHWHLWRASLLLEAAHLWRTSGAACLLLTAAAAALAAMGGAPTASESAELMTWGTHSGVVAATVAALLIAGALDPRSTSCGDALGELGLPYSWELLLLIYVTSVTTMLTVFVFSLIAIETTILWISTNDLVVRVGQVSLQFFFYVSPITAVALSVKFLPLGVAERALSLAILGLVSHRILTPLAIPLDLVALHPAGESWLLSSRSLAESARISVSGTLGGLFLTAAVMRARRER